MNFLKKIIIGLILGVVLLLIAISNLSSVKSTEKKKADYYSICSFDFIIPKPWYSQIPELKNKNFIDDIVPFYISEQSITCDGENANIDLFMIDDILSIKNTPFAAIFCNDKGAKLTENGIVLDERAAKALSADKGKIISFTIGKEKISLKVDYIVMANKFDNLPSAILYYHGKIKKEIEESIKNLSYTGAYVKVNDISKAESYFNNEYRALGNVGIRSWYKDDKSYEYMKSSFDNMSMAKEITNVSHLKATSKSNSDEKKKNNNYSIFTSSAIISFMNIIIWLLILLTTSSNFRNRMKHGTKAGSVFSEFFIGELSTIMAFCIGLYLLQKNESTLIIPLIISIIISFVIVYIFTNNYIKRSFSKIQNKKQDYNMVKEKDNKGK